MRFKQGSKVVSRAVLEQAVLARPDVQEVGRVRLRELPARRLQAGRRVLLGGREALRAERPPVGEPLLNLALAREPGAVEAAERALALDRSDPFNWRKRAFTRFVQGDLEGAIADYEQALALDPERRRRAQEHRALPGAARAAARREAVGHRRESPAR